MYISTFFLVALCGRFALAQHSAPSPKQLSKLFMGSDCLDQERTKIVAEQPNNSRQQLRKNRGCCKKPRFGPWSEGWQDDMSEECIQCVSLFFLLRFLRFAEKVKAPGLNHTLSTLTFATFVNSNNH